MLTVLFWRVFHSFNRDFNRKPRFYKGFGSFPQAERIFGIGHRDASKALCGKAFCPLCDFSGLFGKIRANY
jgi:hypothetical protein